MISSKIKDLSISLYPGLSRNISTSGRSTTSLRMMEEKVDMKMKPRRKESKR